MIRIGFSTRQGNVLSRLIRWFTKSPVSHAWLMIEHPAFRTNMVLQAADGGFHETPFLTFRIGNDVVEVFEPKYWALLVERLPRTLHLFNEPYDYGGLLGMLPVILARRFGKHPRNWLASSAALFCSEAVARILVECKYPEFDMEPSSVSPADLYNFFLEEKASA